MGHFDGPATDGEHIIISGKTMLSGRYVIVQLNQKTILNFQEVKAFGTSANGETADKATECWDKESDPLGEKYDGSVSTTVSGITCQAWASEQPHKPNYNIKGVSELPENHCRNPDKHGGGPWCYTTDKKKKWEICPVPICTSGDANGKGEAGDDYSINQGRSNVVLRGPVDQTKVLGWFESCSGEEDGTWCSKRCKHWTCKD